jgi:manganese efflux pump family protein
MDLVTIILIAFGLTVDSLAVSISTGLVVSHIRFLQAVRIAFVLAVFQGLMPLLGWFLGSQVRDFIIDYDHWIAFFLLFLIGAKMIYESFKKEGEKKDFNPLKYSVMIGMAIATSIDALIVGVSFAFISINILLAIIIIGTLTFLVSMSGMFAGKKVGIYFGRKVEFLGGIVLIAIGIKILFEHLNL